MVVVISRLNFFYWTLKIRKIAKLIFAKFRNFDMAILLLGRIKYLHLTVVRYHHVFNGNVMQNSGRML